jgi:PKD repeat protein
MKRILVITIAALACNKASLSVRDAGDERPSFDTATPSSDVAASLAIDFSVEDCPTFDLQTFTCTGPAPLAVRFVPLATATVTQYFWNFGDSTPFDSQPAPGHIYTTPGPYSVQVVASGVGGVVTKIHTGLIVVQANAIGDPCDTNAQCDQGLFCLCPANAPCTTGPTHGLCASSCQTSACADTDVCANLMTATPQTGKASAWQASTCLRGCTKDADCASGLLCRTLPRGPAGSDWIHGCFTNVPADIGEPCRDSKGDLRDDLCASGLCADLGANGLCSAACDDNVCPPGSDCAVLGDGRRLCLRPCTGNFACANDPLLTCVVPGHGDLGYQLASPVNPNTISSYCAPKPCVSNDACLPTGACVSVTGGGHCARRSN